MTAADVRLLQNAIATEPDLRPTGRVQRGGMLPPRLRRAGWGIGDQALSSLTNFALSIAVARTAGPQGFGVFSLALGVYFVVLSVSRAVSTDPLMVRFSTVDSRAWREASRSATGSSLVIGLAVGPQMVIAGLVIGGAFGSSLVLFGLGLPFLLLQDAWRYAFFAARRGRDAFVNDLLWVAALAAAFGSVLAAGGSRVEYLIAAWIVGAAAAAVFGLWQSRWVPQVRRASRWWRSNWDLASRWALEALVLSASQILVLVGIGLVASLAAVGAVRAGMVLLSALKILTTGIQLFAIPEAAQLLRRSVRTMFRFAMLVGAGLATVALAWGAFLVVMPDQIGRALLGASWEDARELLVPVAVMSAASGAQVGAGIVLKALASAKRSLAARSVTSLMQVGAGIIGGALEGGIGAVCGLALANTVAATVWWIQARRTAMRAGWGTSTVGALADNGGVASTGQMVESGLT